MDLCSGGGCSNALTAPFDDSSMRGNGWDVIVAKSNQMFTVCSLVKLAQVVKFGQWIHTVHVAPHKLCTYKHFVWHDAFVHVIFNQTSTNSDTHTHIKHRIQCGPGTTLYRLYFLQILVYAGKHLPIIIERLHKQTSYVGGQGGSGMRESVWILSMSWNQIRVKVNSLTHTHSILPMKDTICTARLGYIWWQFRFRGYHEPCHWIQTRIQTPKKNGIGNSLICDHLYDFILFHTHNWLSQKMVCMKKNASWFFHNLSCFFFCSFFLLTTDDVCVGTVEGFECWFIIISRDSSPLNEKLWMCNFYSHPFRMQLIFIFVLELLMVLSPHQIFDFFFFRSPNNPYLWWQIENEHFINNVKSFLLIIQFFYH